MKKIIIAVLTAAMCVSLTGCFNGLNNARRLAQLARSLEKKSGAATEAENRITDNITDNITASDYSNTAAVEGKSKLSSDEEFEQNKVKVDGLVLEVPGEERYEITYYCKYQDSFGEDSITIEYEFTNLSKWDRRIDDVFEDVVTAFQNDTELERAFPLIGSPVGAARPGGTVTGLHSYKLRDTEADIVFDMKEVDGIQPVTTGILKIK